jgi:hypothetical protein
MMICINDEFYQWWFVSMMSCINGDLYQWWFVSMVICINDDLYQWWFVSMMICINGDLYQWWVVSMMICINDVSYQWWLVSMVTCNMVWHWFISNNLIAELELYIFYNLWLSAGLDLIPSVVICKIMLWPISIIHTACYDCSMSNKGKLNKCILKQV